MDDKVEYRHTILSTSTLNELILSLIGHLICTLNDLLHFLSLALKKVGALAHNHVYEVLPVHLLRILMAHKRRIRQVMWSTGDCECHVFLICLRLHQDSHESFLACDRPEVG